MAPWCSFDCMHETICGPRRQSGRMRGWKQSDLMTQHHRERPLYCRLKNSRETLTKHSNSPNPPYLLGNNSPFPLHPLLTNYSQIVVFQTHACVCTCVYMGVCGWQRISAVHRDALKVLSWKRMASWILYGSNITTSDVVTLLWRL